MRLVEGSYDVILVVVYRLTDPRRHLQSNRLRRRFGLTGGKSNNSQTHQCRKTHGKGQPFQFSRIFHTVSLLGAFLIAGIFRFW